MEQLQNRTWLEINLDNILHNLHEFRRISKNSNNSNNANKSKQVKIMGVVKANAYGHGAINIAKTLVDDGIDYLAVASLDEAIELRKANICVPILILNHIDTRYCCEVVKNNITQTVYSLELAEALSNCAVKCGKNVKIHVKIDTGMTRVGINWKDAASIVPKIAKLPNVLIEGMFTHFASADETDPNFTQLQFERFRQVENELEESKFIIPIKHVCNSAASIMYPQMHLDMIRVGISLYGLYPSEAVDKNKISLRPVMTFKSQIIKVSEVEKGTSVSYGRIFTTVRKSRIATIPVGYGDGFSRMLTGKAKVLVNGQLFPIVGKICMDQCMIDITDIKGNVNIGDEIILYGEQKGSEITVDDIAKMLGTINYEVLCMAARRTPRYFFKNGELVAAENYLI